MSSSPFSASPAGSPASTAGRLHDVVGEVSGAATVAAFFAANAIARWLVRSDSWILFFLVTKPLVDLTWRWKLFSGFEQEVNIQTVVGLLVLAMNGIAFLAGPRNSRLPRIVLVFLICAMFSVAATPSSLAFNELLRLLAGITFFYTAGRLLADPDRFHRFARLFVLISSVPLFLGFLQLAGVLPYDYWDWIDGVLVGRLSGTYTTPLGVVYLLIYAVPLALYLLNCKSRGSMGRGIAWIFLAAAAIALVFTYHRAGYIVIALEVMLWLYLAKGRKHALALLICLGILVFFSLGALKLFYGQALSDSGEVDSEFLRGRGFQWYLFVNSIYTSGPFHWVFGNGGSVIANVDPNTATILSPEEAHDDFIRILHAYGVLGLVLYISILVQFLRKAIRALRSDYPFARSIAMVMLPVLVAVILLSITTEPTRYPSGVWYLFALGSALFCVPDSQGHAGAVRESGPRP